MNKYRLLSKWFTLVELLIAIIIFGIGVVAIMETVIQNIRQAQQVKELMTMTMLAKEWVELVYNRKDTNALRGLDWNCWNDLLPCSKIDLLWTSSPYNYYKVSMNIDPVNPNLTTSLYEITTKQLPITIDNLKVKIHKQENTDFALYKHDSIWGLPFIYSHDPTDILWNILDPTNFHRYITFEKAYSQWENWGAWDYIDESKLLKMTVTIISRSPWMGKDRPFELETFIWNY